MRPLKFNLNQLNLSVRKFIYDKFFNPNIKNNSYLLLDRSITALIIINLFVMTLQK
jgi:hypothetical protein